MTKLFSNKNIQFILENWVAESPVYVFNQITAFCKAIKKLDADEAKSGEEK